MLWLGALPSQWQCLCFLEALPAAGSAATITQVLGSPSTYDGQHVDVRGAVEHFATKGLA